MQYLGGVCAHCGTTENLEFDHIDPQTKTSPINALLSYRWERIVEELNKCQLLCSACHLKKSQIDESHVCGERVKCAKLTVADIKAIRQLLSGGTTQQVIADRYGVNNSSICRIATRKTWAHVPG